MRWIGLFEIRRIHKNRALTLSYSQIFVKCSWILGPLSLVLRLLVFGRSVDSSNDRSPGRSLTRSMNSLVARSLLRSLTRSLEPSMARSLIARSIDRLVHHSIKHLDEVSPQNSTVDTESGILEARLRPSVQTRDQASERVIERSRDRVIERFSERAIELAFE